MASIRQSKVARLIQKELSEIFLFRKNELSGGAMITVTIVRASPDLAVAKVYLSLYSTKNPEELLENIRSYTNQIRGMLGQRTGKQLRKIPELIFYRDDSLDYIERIEQLLKK
ncbi:MAG: 30S ribosome-binding factor RbfA [Bacteroidia bacterium]|nr:30S ribosome-binding factor RbfA [Bacteroidia bacterium]